MHSVIHGPGSHTRSAHLAQQHAVVHTTLYDLIEAMHEVTAADEDERVVQAIIHLFDTGRIVFRAAGAKHTLPFHLCNPGTERTTATGPGHETDLGTIRTHHPSDIYVGFR